MKVFTKKIQIFEYMTVLRELKNNSNNEIRLRYSFLKYYAGS